MYIYINKHTYLQIRMINRIDVYIYMIIYVRIYLQLIVFSSLHPDFIKPIFCSQPKRQKFRPNLPSTHCSLDGVRRGRVGWVFCDVYQVYMGGSINGGSPNSWMVYKGKSTHTPMIWGFPKWESTPKSSFLPKRSPCNIHAAVTMRFATSASKPASLDAYGNTKRQQSCSHYTAICNLEPRNAKNYSHMNNHSLQNTEEEPIALGSTAVAPVAHRRYLSSPAGAALPEKTRGFLPQLSPKTKPMQHPRSHYNAALQHQVANPLFRRT